MKEPTLVERLKGTAHETDRMCRTMCGILDWLKAEGIERSPSEREWIEILGLSRYELRNVKKYLQADGVIEWDEGKGRKTHAAKVPKGGNTMADRKQWFINKARQELFVRSRWEAMSDMEKAEYKVKLETFVDYWTSEDIHNHGVLKYETCKTFAFKSRWTKWKTNSPTLPAPEPETEKKDGRNIVTFKNQADYDAFVLNLTSKYGDKAWEDYKRNNIIKVKG